MNPPAPGLPAARHRTLALLALLALAAGGLLPYSATLLVHHPDEKHYTDGALQMLASGDYLTPRKADGSPRFRKPVLTYWCVAASYRAFGVSPLTSRAPFLAAGIALLGVTYGLARSVTRDRGTALLAVLILLAHVPLLLAANRAIPDVLLTLWITVSAWGFLRLAEERPRQAAAGVAAYGGAALACLTKGLLGPLFLVTACVCLCSGTPAPGLRCRRVCRPWGLALFVALAATWFLAACLNHGQQVTGQFFTDQLRRQLVRNWYDVFWHLPVYLLYLLLTLCPWSLLAAAGRGTPPPGAAEAPAAGAVNTLGRLAVAWALLLVVVFSFGSFSHRYLLPAVPLLAVLLAVRLRRLPADTLQRRGRPFLAVLLAALGLLAVGAAVFNAQLRLFPASLALLAAGLLGIPLLWRLGTRAPARPALALALSMFLAFPLVFLAAAPTVLPSPATQFRQCLDKLGRPWPPALVMVGNPRLAGWLRVCSSGRIGIVQVERLNPWLLSADAWVLLAERRLDRLPEHAYDVAPAFTVYRGVDPHDALHALCGGRLAAYLETRREPFVLCAPRQP